MITTSTSSGTTAEIERLAKLQPIAYDMVRGIHAEELGIRVGTLDEEVALRRKKLGLDADKLQPLPDKSQPFPDIKPWDEAVAGAGLLTELKRVLKSHVVLSDEAATAISLWVLHAHAHGSAYISPILGITSPTPECGKTTLLTYLVAIVPRPLPASNITSAALFRAVEKWTPTLLVDEADTFLAASDELRGVLNSGHNKANAFVIRTTGDDHEPRHFRTWSPKAIACIGKLPATLASRALHIDLKRKASGEKVIELRQDRLEHLAILARKAARWAADNVKALESAEPKMPPTLTGRRTDNWRHLLAIADAAGGVWPTLARKAAEAMVADDDNQFAGILLLQDIRRYFNEHKKADRVTSQDLAETLKDMLDRPWPEWKGGKPITARQIAKLLGEFKVTPRTVQVKPGDDRTAKGYLKEQFADAFSRYLASASPVSPILFVRPSEVSDSNCLDDTRSVSSHENLTDKIPPNQLKNNDSDGLTDRKGGNGQLRVCEHCGRSAFPGSPLVSASIAGAGYFGHEVCVVDAVPPSKRNGVAG